MSSENTLVVLHSHSGHSTLSVYLTLHISQLTHTHTLTQHYSLKLFYSHSHTHTLLLPEVHDHRYQIQYVLCKRKITGGHYVTFSIHIWPATNECGSTLLSKEAM